MNDKTFTYIFLIVLVVMVTGLFFYLWSNFGGSKKSQNAMDVKKAKILTRDSVNINQDRVKSYSNLDSMPTAKRLNIDFTKINFKSKKRIEEQQPEQTKVQQNQSADQKEKLRNAVSRNYATTSLPTVHKVEPKQETTTPSTTRHRNGFNDSPDEKSSQEDNNTTTSTSINVVVHSDQSVKNGSTVRLRAIEDFMINGIKIPRNTFMSGKVNISGQRVNIHVPTIAYNGKLFDVSYIVYDSGDGLEGANVPDLILHDAAKEELNNSIDQANQITISTPVGVSIPVSTAKKTIQETKAQLTENYKLILRKK